MAVDPFYKQPPEREPEEGGESVNGENAKDASTVRTLKDDVSQMVETNKISTAKIALAEQERRRREGYVEEEPKKSHTMTKISISVVLVVLGIAVILLSFKYNLVPQGVKNFVGLGETKEEIIARESKITFSIDGKNSLEIKNEISNKIRDIKDEPGKVIEFELLKTETIVEEEVEKEVEVNINTRDLFKILESTADDRLKRSMQEDFLFGIYTGFENTPFLILKTTDINLSFSEMYKWEEKMYYELKPILTLKNEVPEFIEIEVASSSLATSTSATTTGTVTTEPTQTNNSTTTNATTSTSTPLMQKIENPAPNFDPKSFEDLVLLNRDIRAIVDEAGEVILLYSFVDNENIVFTKDVEVFKELVQRITSKKLVR